jgi:hypothetical protein
MKKYKSLQEIYLEKTITKVVPGIPGTKIFEGAQILIQKDPPHGEVAGPFDISDDKFKKISKIIKHSEEKEKSIIDEVVKISNLPSEAVIDILNVLEEFSEEEKNKVIDYIGNRTVTLESLNNNNVLDVFQKIGIPRKFSEFLYKYELKSVGAKVGKGEAFFSLMLKGARKASGIKSKNDPDTGDVRIDGQEVEIKGQSARLKGQKGFGSPENVARYWSEELKKISANIPSLREKIPAPSSLEWNFKDDGGYALDRLGQEIIKASGGSFTLENLKALWKGGLILLYPSAEESKLKFIDDSYKTGSFDKKLFVKEFIKFATLYYFDIQKINFIVISKFDIRGKEITKKGSISPAASQRLGLLRIVTREDVDTDAIFSKASFKLPQIGGAGGVWGSGLGISVI